MKLIIALMLLASCGTKTTTERIVLSGSQAQEPTQPIPGDPRQAVDIDDEFSLYTDEWLLLHPEGKPVTTPMSFTDIPEEGVLGVCITWIKGDIILKEIRIDEPSYREQMDLNPIGPHTIIFHELGHCELDRPHLDLLSQLEGKIIPFSIMFPSLFPRTALYKELEAHYLDELFGGPGTIPPVSRFESITKSRTMEKNGFVGIGILN